MKQKLELPEIETLRRDLEREFATRKVKGIEIKSMKQMPRHRAKKEVEEFLVGFKVEMAERYGMHLALRMENNYLLVITLGEEGTIAKGAQGKGSDVIVSVSFTQGGDLHISDGGNSVSISVVPDEDLAEVVVDPDQPGIDLQAEPLSWVDFGRIVMSHKMPLKLFLTDPTIFIGIGDIYSNEILYDAGLMYDRVTNELSTQELRRLYRSAVGVLHEATKYGGTSIEKRPFVNLTGVEGEYATQLNVYGKAGDLSPRSRLPIKKTKFKNHAVFYCETQV